MTCVTTSWRGQATTKEARLGYLLFVLSPLTLLFRAFFLATTASQAQRFQDMIFTGSLSFNGARAP